MWSYTCLVVFLEVCEVEADVHSFVGDDWGVGFVFATGGGFEFVSYVCVNFGVGF